jgi:hypothetical protein
MRQLILTLYVLLWSAVAQAATYYVATTGNDTTGTGAVGAPWRTIQKAATIAAAGDTVNVAAGTYQERHILFTNSGSVSGQITFVGAANHATIIDGGVDLTGWTQSGAGYVSTVWERANSAFGFTSGVPAHATANGQMISFLKPGELGAVGNQDVWLNRTAGDAAWLGIEAVCANYNTITRCRFEAGTNPNTIDLRLAPERIGIFHIDNRSYITLTGFTFRSGYSAVIMRNFAHHITVSDNIIQHGFHALEISGGAHHITVEGNATDLKWIYEDHGHSQKNTGNTINTVQNNILQMLRTRMPVVSSVLIADGGTDIRLTNNVFDRTGAAGLNMYSLGSNYLLPEYGQQNLQVDHNIFGHCQDYCIQIQLTVAPNAQIHNNLFNIYNSGIRLGQIRNAQGPMYIYKNRFSNATGPLANCGAADLEISGFPTPTTSNFTGTAMYYYHNTVAGADCGLAAYSSQNLDNYYFINNIWSAGKNFVFELSGNPDFFSAAWIGGAGYSTNPGFMTGTILWNTPNRIWSNAETTFALTAGHAAIDAGINLSQTWSAGAQGSKPALPGMTVGYFIGSAPDLGAVEFGEEIPPDPPAVAPTGLSGRATVSGRIQVK